MNDQMPKPIRISGHHKRSQPHSSTPKLWARNKHPRTMRMMPLLFMSKPLLVGRELRLMVIECRMKQAPVDRGLSVQRQAKLERLDAHRLTILRALDGIAHFAIDQCEQRVIAADADVGAGMKLGATLADDDRAGRNGLATEHLHAEHLRLGVAAVPGGTAAFFLCHGSGLLECGSSGVHRADFDLGEVLAMTLPLLVVLATTHLEDAHLVMPALSQDFGHHARARHQGSPDLQVSAVTDSQHLVDRDLLANIRSNLFYLDLFAGGNLVLFAAGFYDRVHISPFDSNRYCFNAATTPRLPQSL